MGKKKKALTLIEVIVTMAVMSLVSIIIFTVFFTNNKMITKSEIKSELQSEADSFSEKIIKFGSQAISIGELSINGLSGSYNASTEQNIITTTNDSFNINELTLELPPKDYNLCEITNSSQVVQCKLTWDSNDKTLNWLDRNGNNYILCKNVKAVEMNFLGYNGSDLLKDAKGIEIKVEFEKKKGGQTVTYEISNKIYFRNNQYKDFV